MLTIPETAFRPDGHEKGMTLSLAGRLDLPGIPVIPADDGLPVLRAIVPSTGTGRVPFQLAGKVPLPLAGDLLWVPITGTMLTERHDGGSCSVTKATGEAMLPEVPLAPDTILVNGRLALSSCRYRLHLRVTGEVRFTAPEETAGACGRLDAEILHHAENGIESFALSTLLSDAAVSLRQGISMEHGTIRFELCCPPEAAVGFSRRFDEDDELLYRLDTPIGFGALRIAGQPGNSVTIAAELRPAPAGTKLLLSIFPARITAPWFGSDMTLFVHGSHYDDPFTIDVCGPWSARCSNNVHFHLTAPEDRSGKPLCNGIAMLEGDVAGNGLTSASLELHSAAPVSIPLFPESDFRTDLPLQQIGFSMNESGSVHCSLQLPSPVDLSDCSLVRKDDGGATIPAAVCPEGLRIESADLSADTRGKLIQKGPLIIDGKGLINAE